MNKNQLVRIGIGVLMLFIGYYLSTPVLVPLGLKYSIYHGLSSLKISIFFPLQNIIPAMLLLGGLGVLLRLIIKSKWIILVVLLVVGFLLTRSFGILPIGYLMFGSTRYFYLGGLTFFLWAILEIDDSLRKRTTT